MSSTEWPGSRVITGGESEALLLSEDKHGQEGDRKM